MGVSGWALARTVSKLGQLGVVSGTGLDGLLARKLQTGDPGGHVRRALDHFPVPEVAKRVWDRYFLEGGVAEDQKYKGMPMHSVASPGHLDELAVTGNFVEVFLAREGHDGPIGINFLEKIQMPLLPSLYGAMLAGVTYVLVGAGIPRSIPGIMDGYARGGAAKMRLDVTGAQRGEEFFMHFDPGAIWGGPAPEIARPKFLGIISSATLAMTLARKSSGRVDGFIVEGPLAGGHNAPPRGKLQLSEEGEPVYGERDVADLEKIGREGLPYWLAGTFGRPGRLQEACALGATGVQVGTAFAFCDESGINPAIKRQVIQASRRGDLEIFTDPLASPTGFPFKVVQLEGSVTDADHGKAEPRQRVCDLGYLRTAYRKENGTLGYRCASEPVEHFIKKGGSLEDTVGRKCLCNGLISTIKYGQKRAGGEVEKPLVTAGNDVVDVAKFAKDGEDSYTAADVVRVLLG
jgi:nitronate monooxygenase